MFTKSAVILATLSLATSLALAAPKTPKAEPAPAKVAVSEVKVEAPAQAAPVPRTPGGVRLVQIYNVPQIALCAPGANADCAPKR